MDEKFILLPFDTKYAISNKGKLINVKNGKELKTRINMNGYLEVQLSTNGMKRTYRIHRLVAIAFLDNIENKPYINHKNGIKYDNRVENLEWCSHSYNTLHAYAQGLEKKVTGIHHHAAKLSREDVLYLLLLILFI